MPLPHVSWDWELTLSVKEREKERRIEKQATFFPSLIETAQFPCGRNWQKIQDFFFLKLQPTAKTRRFFVQKCNILNKKKMCQYRICILGHFFTSSSFHCCARSFYFVASRPSVIYLFTKAMTMKKYRHTHHSSSCCLVWITEWTFCLYTHIFCLPFNSQKEDPNKEGIGRRVFIELNNNT